MVSQIVTPILVAVCLAFGAQEVAPAGTQPQQKRRQPGWPCAGTVDPAYVRSAEATGGVVMLAKPGETAVVAAESSASVRHDQVVFRGSGQFAEGLHEFDVPIDSTIESAYFFVSIQCLQDVTIIRPSGEPLRVDAAGVEHHPFEAIRLFTVREPSPGLWSVRVTGRGFLSLIVKAKTTLSLTSVLFPGAGFPLKRTDKPQRIEATLDGAPGQVAFELASAGAAPIAPLDLVLDKTTDTLRTYSGDVVPPPGEFRVSVTGVDSQGFRFQRVHRQMFLTEP